MKQGDLNMIHIDHVYTVKKLVQKVRDYYFNENDSVKLDFDQISADYWNHWFGVDNFRIACQSCNCAAKD